MTPKQEQVLKAIFSAHKKGFEFPASIWAPKFGLSRATAWKYNRVFVEEGALIKADRADYVVNKRLPKELKKIYISSK